MTKTIVIVSGILSLCFISVMVLAGPVSPEDAHRAAGVFIAEQSRNMPQTLMTAKSSTSEVRSALKRSDGIISASGMTNGYVVPLSPRGFVLIRADDELPPVKLFSLNGAISNMPPDFMTCMRLELELESESLRSSTKRAMSASGVKQKQAWDRLLSEPLLSDNQDRMSSEGLSTAQGVALVTTTWDQEYPYNYYAPSGSSGRALAGCVAVAMGQIMRYHTHPAKITGNPYYYDYGSYSGWRYAGDAGLSDYNWANMPAAINSGSSSARKKAIGQLLYHCGVAVKMDYESDGSGAYDSAVVTALKTEFNYDCQNISSRNSTSAMGWKNSIIGSIEANQPVYYSFETYISGRVGHAVVCDGWGYNTGNFIMHLNMGWGGGSDAWYFPNSVVDSKKREWVNHNAIFGITPKRSPSTVLTPVHRFWSDRFGAHFYIVGDSERDRIAAKYRGIWKYEAVAWYAYPAQATGTQPVHRFWSDKLGKHFYIMGDSERDRIISKYWGVWKYEAVAWYAYPTQVTGTEPVGRFWSDRFMGHFYTIGLSEINRIAYKYWGIWNYETIAYYAFTSASRMEGNKSFASAEMNPVLDEVEKSQDQCSMPIDTVSIVNAVDFPDFDVVYPLAYPECQVTAQVYDSVAEQWTPVFAVTNSPSTAVLESVKPDRSYLVEVFANDSADVELKSVYRSWFDFQLDPPETISEGDSSEVVLGSVGTPTVRIRIPAEEGTLKVKLYSSQVGVVQTVEEVMGGDIVELSLPEWNGWYWISGWRDVNDSLVLSLWVRIEAEK